MPHAFYRHGRAYAVRREVNELFVSMTLKHIAFGLIAVFEPIYIYLFFGGDIVSTLLYFSITFLVFSFLVPWSGKVLSRIGVKHSILISVFFAISYFWGLRVLPDIPWLVFVLPVLSIFYKFFFWPAFHLDFSMFSRRDHLARQVSILKMIMLAAGILGPFAGGLIIATYGYAEVFLLVVILLMASVIPLFMSKEVYETFVFSPRTFIRTLFSSQGRKREIAFASWGIEEMVSVLIWPIFMFLVVRNSSIIGGVTSAATVVAFLSAYWVGRLADRIGRERFLRWSSIVNFFAWIGRAIVKTPLQLAAADSAYRISEEGTYIGLTSVLYDRANLDAQQRLSIILRREVITNIGKFLSIVVILLAVVLTDSFIPAFFLAAVTSLFFRYL